MYEKQLIMIIVKYCFKKVILPFNMGIHYGANQAVLFFFYITQIPHAIISVRV